MTIISYPVGEGRHEEPVRAAWTASADPEAYEVHFTAQQVRALLRETMSTLRRLESKGCFPSQLRSAHPDIVRLASESYGYDDVRVRPSRPSAAAISAMEGVLVLLYRLDPDERLAAAGVALGLSLRRVGLHLGVSYETIRTRERNGINALTAALLQASGRFQGPKP